jgi:transposase
MQSITLASEERKNLIRKMKRERQPSRRLRMHIVLLCAEGRSPTEIGRVLFCSRTTVYVVVARFVRERQAAFNDRTRRGPKPLIEEPANQYIERLVEEESPTSHGWLRSRWSCKLLAVELFKERAALVSRETVRRTLHRLGFRWRRPRPLPPEKDSEDQREQKRRRLLGILSMVEEAGAFFQDETSLEINPKVGFCWMRKGKQRQLRTPGTNRKVWISGALNFHTGRLHWVKGERKNDELFMKAARLVAEGLPLPQAVAPGNRQRREPHQQTSRALRGGFGRTHSPASFAFVVSGEQSGGIGVVVVA